MAKIETFGATKQVLGFVANKVALGVVLSDEGVDADALGRKVIPAGTPVGGDASTLADEQAVLKVVADGTAQGVLEHEVDVTAGQGNGTLIINGYINENRLPENVTITDETKTALAGRVVFFKRNA
ncbi:hypothetical protein [Loigolactobacillus bifermentans]|uniref:Uncharacterized protein n=1 Tax=Loigolactobacillus bifermentans DSM 20003 TaxID=1423726 RepID=A0A0R1H2M8_9LACO|nr:hypothetical protein [Loigolactobacillus bifermentans]KRK40806.1 hypothetical protein FC07_GL002555 [Loigolactobacillus bifermentans DSM 20003]QGG59558.1 hypothetical protein LB003_03160 [Loigolactobacillus bifermentans]